MSNIIRFKKPFKFHFGLAIYIGLLIYLVIVFINFVVQKRTSIYEIQIGDLSTSFNYTALAIRDETVISAKSSGYISYFADENTKVGAKSLVYALDQTGDIYKAIKAQIKDNGNEEFLSAERKKELLDIMDEFSYNYSDYSFYLSYGLKDSLNLKIVENLANEEGGAKFFKGMSAYFSKKTGVVSYCIDGLEDVSIDSFDDKDIYGTSYQTKNLKQNEYVDKGDAVYKLITDENWTLVAPIDARLKDMLKEQQYVNTTIKNDNFTADLPFEIINKNGKDFIVLSMSNGCIRYASLRYLDIELTINQTKGYKIPNSSIFEVDFLMIPKDYLIKSGSEDGFLKVQKDKKGNETVVFVAATVFDSDDDFYYVHSETLKRKEQLQNPQSNQRLILDDTKAYSCVYCVNKGYCVLKRVDIIDYNEDYSIARIGVSHSVNNYDHIVLDGKQLQEGEFVH